MFRWNYNHTISIDFFFLCNTKTAILTIFRSSHVLHWLCCTCSCNCALLHTTLYSHVLLDCMSAPLHSLQTVKIILFSQLMVVIEQLYLAELEASRIIFTLKAFISGTICNVHNTVVQVLQPLTDWLTLFIPQCYLHNVIEKKWIHECGLDCRRYMYLLYYIWFLFNPVFFFVHCRIPWFHYPIVYDIRSRPRKIFSPTGSKGTYDNSGMMQS